MKSVTGGSGFSLSNAQTKILENHVNEDPGKAAAATEAFAQLAGKETFTVSRSRAETRCSICSVLFLKNHR